MKKCISGIALAIALSQFVSISSYAAVWKQDAKGWWVDNLVPFIWRMLIIALKVFIISR